MAAKNLLTRMSRGVLGALPTAIVPIAVLVLIPAAFLMGYALRGPESIPEATHAHEEAPSVWTCSMHPQVRQPAPGKCPICSMDLIPLKEGGDDVAGAPRLVTTPAARALMNIRTSMAERRAVTHPVRLVGKLEYDETKLATITAWVGGRLDRLYVDYTGVQVKKGDHLVYLYSPELLAAQADLQRAAKALGAMSASAPEVLKQTARTTLEASREKLRRWGMTDAQVAQAEKKGITSDHVTIYAPIAGTVVQRSGQEGLYVSMGTVLYTIADLGSLWVKLDAYESDLAWLRYGQRVSFTTEAYPGETFAGSISFIDPVLDKTTRTAKVRVIVQNEAGRLKPEMFVRATAQADVGEGGRVRGPSLAGKWVSPMHPEIIKDQPGTCDVCGMALVSAEELGLVEEVPGLPLVIPASAPLVTGTRAVVYVEDASAEKPTFEGREIVLGPRAGAFYTVHSGLQEGERVVTNGNFKIDSALQIQAKASMMSMGSEMPMAAHDHAAHSPGTKMDMAAPQEMGAPEAFQKQIRALSDAYLVVSEALASDDFAAAKDAVKECAGTLEAVDMTLLKGEAHMAWMARSEAMSKALASMTAAKDIETLRVPLLPLTKNLTGAIETFGVGSGAPIYQAHCPMAFDGKGGDWLQAGQDVRNPYYGDMMLSCGAIVRDVTEAAEGARDE